MAVAASAEAQSDESLAAGVVVVTSAYGGEGKTTVAAGLGFALGVATSTLIWDADTRGSSLEFHVGADPARNACLLARRELDTPVAWDVALERELQPVGTPSNAALLCGVTKPSLRTLLSVAYVEHLMQALRERYRFVVVDTSGAGWAPDDAELDRTILNTADRVLLVLRPDVQGIARARRVLRDWPHRDRIALVLNQAGLPGQERGAEVEVTLGIPVAAVLPADPRGVAAARVRHRPVVCQPGCRVAAPIVDLAGRIAGGASITLPVDEDAASKRTWLQRLPVPVLGALR